MSRALGIYIIVEKIKDAPKKVGGIEIEAKKDNEIRFVSGKVYMVGEAIEWKGEPLVEGDTVKYDKMQGHGVVLDGKDYHVLKLQDIAIVC